MGPAASALGTSVLTPTPSAVKLSMPTTSASTNGPDVGRARARRSRSGPTSSTSTIWMPATIMVLTKMAASRIQVGSGLRRRRLSKPISRRFTS